MIGDFLWAHWSLGLRVLEPEKLVILSLSKFPGNFSRGTEKNTRSVEQLFLTVDNEPILFQLMWTYQFVHIYRCAL